MTDGVKHWPVCGVPFNDKNYNLLCVAQEANGDDTEVGPAIAALMKLSFSEEYRAVIGLLG